MSEPYRPVGPQAVTARVAAIVLAVAARTHPSMTEVARTVGLPVSTTHRLLSGLVAGRLVERTMHGRFRLDPSALPTWSGSAALRAHISAAVVDLADITPSRCRPTPVARSPHRRLCAKPSRQSGCAVWQ
jgi:hypothetical protein